MSSDTQSNERVRAFVETCHRQGVKATHQRMEVLRELASTREHPDVETIYRRVRNRIPTISLDTVYRTLHLLEDAGVITRTGTLDGKARFDANTARHHHFVCTKCGKIQDWNNDSYDALATTSNASHLGEVHSVHVELRGRCLACGRVRTAPPRKKPAGTDV